MQTTKQLEKLDHRDLTVKLSFNKNSNHFFVDLWDENTYLVSIKLTEAQCMAISRDIGVKIFE
jgi:hypothetical protein